MEGLIKKLEGKVYDMRIAFEGLRLLYELAEDGFMEDEWMEENAITWMKMLKLALDEAFRHLERVESIEDKLHIFAMAGGV